MLSALFLLINCEQFELWLERKKSLSYRLHFPGEHIRTHSCLSRLMNIVSTQFFDLFYFSIQSHTQFAAIISRRILKRTLINTDTEWALSTLLERNWKKKTITKFISFFVHSNEQLDIHSLKNTMTHFRRISPLLGMEKNSTKSPMNWILGRELCRVEIYDSFNRTKK